MQVNPSVHSNGEDLMVFFMLNSEVVPGTDGSSLKSKLEENRARREDDTPGYCVVTVGVGGVGLRNDPRWWPVLVYEYSSRFRNILCYLT